MQHTFLGLVPVFSTFAYALDVDLFRFSQFTAVFALCDGTAFFLNLEQGAVSVFAVGRAMTLDASLAGQEMRDGRGIRGMGTAQAYFLLLMRTWIREG